MCGIAGIVRPTDVQIDLVPEVFARLQHRGPDDRGWFCYGQGQSLAGREWQRSPFKPELILLHLRLSILDLTVAGWQPMSTADNRYHVIFNGEIYNYIELREELEHLGHKFRSSSDTEVLLAAHAQWGVDAVRRFVGMFAFAIFDCQEKKILFARDPFGIKPLYYRFEGGSLLFASEIKGLLAFGLRPQINPETLLLYLRHGISDHGADTMLRSVSQLPAGHWMEFSLDCHSRPEPVCYWRPRPLPTRDISFDEAVRGVQERFLRSVRWHLRSDVPVGTALSGGIDSSSIVASVRHSNPGAEIHTFSFIADQANLSEERWIDVVNSANHAISHKVRVGPEELAEDLRAVIDLQDLPFGSTSPYAQFRVFQVAQQHGIKVMLDGQGADEIFAGYEPYRGARLGTLIRQRQWRTAARFLKRSPAKGSTIMHAGQVLLPGWLQAPARRFVGRELTPKWIDKRWLERNGLQTGAVPSSGQELLKEELCRSQTHTSLPHLLRYEDRNSMAFSIESRVPFLTTEIVDFALSLPEEYLVSNDGVSKYVFRQAMRGIVPDAVLDRRDKIGFATPERNWLQALGRLIDGALDSATARTAGFFDINAAHREWSDVRAGNRRFGFHIWRWFNIILWSERLRIDLT